MIIYLFIYLDYMENGEENMRKIIGKQMFKIFFSNFLIKKVKKCLGYVWL